MRVLLVNNYDISDIWEKWSQEHSPAHHLWGITDLPKYGIEADILPFEKYVTLKKIGQKLRILGDLDQQLRVILNQDKYDVIYSGHHLTTLSLAFLRSIGVFKKPVVAITYQSFNKNLLTQLFTQLFVQGHDKLFCLTDGIKEHLREEYHISKEKLEVLEWGTDLPFYEFQEGGSVDVKDASTRFIMSAGKTYRDYNVLVKAFSEINCPLKIYSSGKFVVSDTLEIPANVCAIKNSVSWKEIIAEYQKAYAVAIPLNVSQGTAHNAIGITSLIETMAMGKAVVMTKNGEVGIDIEKEGTGIFVEQGDVKGWQQAISHLLENPSLTQEMGSKARYLCEKKYNLETFSLRLANFLKDVAN